MFWFDLIKLCEGVMSEVGQSSEAYEGNQGDQIFKSMAWIILIIYN